MKTHNFFPILFAALLILSGCGSSDSDDEESDGWIKIETPTSSSAYQAMPSQSQITVSGTVFQKTVNVCETSFPWPFFIPVVECNPSSDIFICVFNFPSIDSCTSFTSSTGEWEFTINLSSGENNIEVHAHDANGDNAARDNLYVTLPSLRPNPLFQHSSRESIFSVMVNDDTLPQDFELADLDLAMPGINLGRVDETINNHGQSAITWNQDLQFIYAAVYSEHTGWSGPVLISDIGTRVYTYPKINIDNEGNAIVAWFLNSEIYKVEYRPEHGWSQVK